MNISGFGGAASGSASAASERQYEYPTVREIAVYREPTGPDPFADFGTPQRAPMNLSEHFESLAEHHDNMYGNAMLNLGRALMKESGQLVLDLDLSPQASITPGVPAESPPSGPPAEMPEVKTCDHAECDCD